MTDRAPTPDEIAAMTPDEYDELEDRVRYEAAKYGLRYEHSRSPEHHNRPYRLVEIEHSTLLPRGFAWGWQTLAELVELTPGAESLWAPTHSGRSHSRRDERPAGPGNARRRRR